MARPTLFKQVYIRRDDPYWISEESSLELIELSSINIVRLV
jgi:hypothetical protein